MNVGDRQVVNHRGRRIETGIWKHPVDGQQLVGPLGLAGDVRADSHAHGGPDKALYAYAVEDYEWWSSQLGSPLEPGAFGENLTVEGVDVSGALIGDRWLIGTTLVEVSEPRLPCYKLDIRMAESRFSRRFAAAGRPGAYLRVIVRGTIQSGDRIVRRAAPAPSTTVGDVARIYDRERHRASELLEIAGLSPAWKMWARQTLELRGRHGL